MGIGKPYKRRTNNETSCRKIIFMVNYGFAMSDFDVSIIVLTYNSEKTIEKCIKSLIEQDVKDIRYEIITLDGGSKDETLRILERYNVSVIVAPRTTIGWGRNKGVELSRGKFIAFIDSDCIADRHWLETLVNAIVHAQDNVVGIGGPNLVPRDIPSTIKAIMFMQRTFLGSGGTPATYEFNKVRYVYSIPNCNAIYRKSVLTFERYDDQLNVGEDADINYRLTKKGFRLLYIPNAIVWHYQYLSVKDFLKKVFRYGATMAKLIKKHRSIIRWYAPIPTICLFVFLTLLLLACINPSAIPLLMYLSLAYLMYAFACTVEAYLRSRDKSILLVVVYLPLQHITYGLGFLLGLLRTTNKLQ